MFVLLWRLLGVGLASYVLESRAMAKGVLLKRIWGEKRILSGGGWERKRKG